MKCFADGRDLRAKREDRCLSLADLSELSGVSKGSIGNFETGARGLSSKAQRALYEALVPGADRKQTIADGSAARPCLHCAKKDKEIAELRRQLALLIETNASLAQGRGYRELRKRGVTRDLAWNTSKSGHGPWWLRMSPALSFALPTGYFVGLGLPLLHQDS